LRTLHLESLIDRWYEYRRELVAQKKQRRHVYSRTYEFFSILTGDMPDREDEMTIAYDNLLDESEVEEKVEL
jgi:hypothetical protein